MDGPTFSVTLPARDLELDSGRLSLPCMTLAVDAPGSETLGERTVLRHPEAVQLAAQYVGQVRVKRVEDASLVPDADYDVNEDCGHIRGNARLHGRTVDVEFRAYRHRYDIVGFDRRRAIAVHLPGTARLVDPEEYRPSPNGDIVPIYGLYVWKDGVDIVDVSGWDRFVRKTEQRQFQLLRRAFQTALEPALEAARRRKTVKIGGYGDSITSIGQRVAGMHAFPNGPIRDSRSYFSRYPKDTLARIASRKSDDGVRHTQVGWCWSLAKAFEREDIAVEYRNWGLPGTTADASLKVDGNNVECYGGGHPERLKYLVADACDIVVLGFGTNEIGEAGVYDRLRGIIERTQASGARCIVVGAPPLNPYTAVRSYEAWCLTNAEIKRAAEVTKSAYLPLENLFALGNEGATGLSRRSYAAGNLINHPGLSEFRAIGDYLVSLTF